MAQFRERIETLAFRCRNSLVTKDELNQFWSDWYYALDKDSIDWSEWKDWTEYGSEELDRQLDVILSKDWMRKGD